MCTAFASYHKKPVYGWNFDYDPTDIYVSIRSEGELKLFTLYGNYSGNRVTLLMFSSYGLFACYNALPDPKMRFNLEKSGSMFPMTEIWKAISPLKSAREVQELFRDKVLTYYPLKRNDLPPSSFHYLFADRTGGAFILEYDLEETYLTPIAGKHLVMTNFANCKDIPANDTPFNGRDRFLYALDYIEKHKDNFSLEEGLRVLLHTQQQAAWKTLISIAYDAEKNSVYFTLNRRNSTLFKINLAEGLLKGLGRVKQGVSIPITDELFDLKGLEKYYE